MERFLAVVMLGGTALVQIAGAQVASQQILNSQASLKSGSASADLPALPAPPKGKSTILGGSIRNVDPVRDQLTLKVFGQKPLKILFDERTEVYRDGKRIRLQDMRPSEDHVSVQTLLDGTNIFAVSIHMLSQAPQGDYQGNVVSFNPETNVLTLTAPPPGQPLKLFVSGSTQYFRRGQASFAAVHSGVSDLATGSLVSVQFESDKQGRGVATQVTVLATPGSEFVFSGSLSFIDMHSGLFVVVDPRDDKSYQIHFDSSRLTGTQDLHPGDNVRVTAAFDGTRYVAREITPN
jgi:cold shock CspA family protein